MVLLVKLIFHTNFMNIYLYLQIIFLKNNNIIFVLSTRLEEWSKNFCLLLIKHLKINYYYEDLGDYRLEPCIFNISSYKNFNNILNLKKEYKKEYNNNYKVLYFRNEANTRKMINGELDNLFDEIIYDMSSLSFENYVKLFMKTSHFVTIEGANLTNIIFMNKESKVLSISNQDNSWPVMFGTSLCVKKFKKHITYSGNFNDNIYYNIQIKNIIEDFIKN